MFVHYHALFTKKPSLSFLCDYRSINDLKATKLIDKTMIQMIKEYDLDTEFILIVSIEKDGAPILQPYTLFCDGTRPTQKSADEGATQSEDHKTNEHDEDGGDDDDVRMQSESKAKNETEAASPAAPVKQEQLIKVCAKIGCTNTATLKLCGRCKQVSYCSTKCQVDSWKLHKNTCKPT